MKNEFLFKRILLKNDAKKHYASNVELQEGNIIPNSINEKLDIKGFAALKKSTVNDATKSRLKKIIYEDILNSADIDQIKILKNLAILEKEIFNSLASGSKDFYKPAVIKSYETYESPMRIQGMKGALIYNALRNSNEAEIDTLKRNSVDIAKVDMNPKNADKIKDTFPEVYERLVELLDNPSYGPEITAISIPYGEDVPKWVIPFIDYTTIINDNISGFPLQSCGLHFATGPNNYTNILQI